MSYTTEPLRIHKGLVIKLLREHPEELPRIMDGFESAAEAIAALENSRHEWIVDGVFKLKD